MTDQLAALVNELAVALEAEAMCDCLDLYCRHVMELREAAMRVVAEWGKEEK